MVDVSNASNYYVLGKSVKQQDPTAAVTMNTSKTLSIEGGGKSGSAGFSIMDLGRSLLEAAREGNTNQVYEFMSKGAPFTTDWLGTSPLHLAAKNNHVETCQVLLRGGLNKDSKTKVERTPLHFAVFEGHVEVVKLLLSHKCNPNAQDMLKMTPLHWAVEKGFTEIVDLLLRNGADTSVKSKFGKTPIAIAAERQNVVMLKRLVDPANAKLTTPAKTQTTTKTPAKTSREDDVIIEDLIESDVDDSIIEEDDEEDNQSTIGDAFMQLPDQESSHTSKAGMELLKEHGIQLMKVDDTGSVIQSALDSGRRLILSEAGKFILKNAANSNHTILPPMNKATSNSVALTRQKLNMMHRNAALQKAAAAGINIVNHQSLFVPPVAATNTTNVSPNRKSKRTKSNSLSPASSPSAKQQKLSQSTTNTTTNFPEFGKLPQSTTITMQDTRSSSSKQLQQSVATLAVQQTEVIDLDEELPTINGTVTENGGGSGGSRETGMAELEKQVQELKKETGNLRKQLEVTQKQNQDYQRRLEKLEAIILSFHRSQLQQSGRMHSVT